MTKRTGSYPHCGGTILAVDPDADRVLYGIFGDRMEEHYPGCDDYPDMTEIELSDL